MNEVASAKWVRKVESDLKDLADRFNALTVTPDSGIGNFKIKAAKPTLDLTALSQRITALENK